MTIQTGTNEKRSKNGDLDGQNIVTWLWKRLRALLEWTTGAMQHKA